jgi:hypothetical protein
MARKRPSQELPAGSRLALFAALPALIMLLVGFGVGIAIGIDRIGVWKTLLVWGVVFGLLAVGVVLRLRKSRAD